MTSWTAEFAWPGSPQAARKRISEWTGTLAWTALEFQIDEAGAATATLTVEADVLLEAYALARHIIDGFLGPETELERLAATPAF